MKTCLIITGGEYNSLPVSLKFDYAIACDKGIEYAMRMSIIPDLFIGDFDSFELNSLPKEYERIPVLTFPVRKDDTDTMLAIKHSLSKGFDNIILTCALGYRMDHTIANLQTLHYIANHGATAELYSDTEYMRTISSTDGKVYIKKRENYSFSLLALTDVVKNVKIQGTEYDCITDFTNNFPLGHGNVFINNEAIISVESGVLLVVCSSFEREL